jgi:two-component system, NarL family, response regulator LiaR
MSGAASESHARNKIRVILVDDKDTIHQEIGALLSSFDDIELVAHGCTGEEAIALCDQFQPDIVLMDIVMPGLNGIDATEAIIIHHPDTKIIAMTGLNDARAVQEMITAGAVGYVLKETHPEELASILRTVYSGKSVFSKEAVKNVLAPKPTVYSRPDYGLTRREAEILRYLIDGMSNSEIATALTISQATVKFHISNILRKLGVGTRSAAVALATKQGFAL